ncbi:hypothetical protein [Vibrio alfacsensis]|uniref:hypothetical protein n=1 Tax=Vibrio alfacsensis TaxID=1074311 RepID=UPI0040691763
MKKILLSEFNIEKIGSPKHILGTITSSSRRDILLLNWYEDIVSEKKICQFCVHTIFLIVISFWFKRVIWIRHNFKPHNHNNMIRYKILCYIITLVSYRKCCHRDNIDGYEYIPHPTYNIEPSNLIDNQITNDEHYDIIFGQIKKYKGIVEILNKWPKEKKLLIVGRSESLSLYNDIITVIEERGLDVCFINEFVDDNRLEQLIFNSRHVILPHLDKTMIVSGAFFHAASLGKPVLLHRGGFYDYLVKKFSFVSEIGSTNLDITSEQVIFELQKECDDDIILRRFKELISLNR